MRWGWVVVALAVAGVVLCQRELDNRLGRFRAQEEVLYVWTGEHLQRMAPGFEGLLADVYWLRTVQYYGGQRAFVGDKRYDLLEPLVNITTSLDPTFAVAYRYGASSSIRATQPPRRAICFRGPRGRGPRDGSAPLRPTSLPGVANAMQRDRSGVAWASLRRKSPSERWHGSTFNASTLSISLAS